MESVEVIEARKTRKEANEKLNELYSQRAEVDQRIEEINNLTRKDGETQEESPLTKAAHALLRGEDILPVNIAPLFEERDDLKRKKRVIDEAIHLQRRTVDEAINALSIAMGKARRPEYKAIIKNHVKCLIAVAKSTEDSVEFQSSFRREGLSFSIGTGKATHFSHVGLLSDRHSYINFYLRELMEIGWLTKEEIAEMKAA